MDQIHDEGAVDEEPLYVNAKQYYRILKRRIARARLEEVHRLSRQRKVRRLVVHREWHIPTLSAPAVSPRVPPQTCHAPPPRPWRSIPHRGRDRGAEKSAARGRTVRVHLPGR